MIVNNFNFYRAVTKMTSSPADRLIIGYIADSRGIDALELGIHLALGTGTELVITMVLPEPSRFGGGHIGPFTADDHILADQLRAWGDEAMGRVPEGVRARLEYRYASSEAHGLLDAADEHDALAIVIGAQAGPVLRAFSIGTVANTLLHSSPVPVALAPGGYSHRSGPIGRVTGVYGTRAGSEAVIGRALQRAVARDVPLRRVARVQGDGVEPREIREITDAARAFGGRELEARAAGLLDSGRATIEIAEGRDLDEALEHIEWRDDEYAMIGSSRLGRGRSVFLGSRARRILRALPVPVVIIPSELAD